MIIYRPHRGCLAEAMAEAQVFDTVDAMKEHIVQHWHDIFGYDMFEPEDIVIDFDKPGHNDERIGWEDTHYVCVKCMGAEAYDTPQCIGMCATIFPTVQSKATEQSLYAEICEQIKAFAAPIERDADGNVTSGHMRARLLDNLV